MLLITTILKSGVWKSLSLSSSLSFCRMPGSVKAVCRKLMSVNINIISERTMIGMKLKLSSCSNSLTVKALKTPVAMMRTVTAAMNGKALHILPSDEQPWKFGSDSRS